MGRIVNGTLFISEITSTNNAGEYLIAGAEYENQADATGNGANDLAVGFLVYINATDVNSAAPVPGVMHRYKVTELTVLSSTRINCKILWDEGGSEVDIPTAGSFAIITESTPVNKLGLPPSAAVYANLPGGAEIGALDADIRSKYDTSLSGSGGGPQVTVSGSNVGTSSGLEVYKDNTVSSSTNVLNFRKLRPGNNIDIILDGDDLVIETTAESNTAQNVGQGTGLFYQKSGSTLQFRSIFGSNISVSLESKDFPNDTLKLTGLPDLHIKIMVNTSGSLIEANSPVSKRSDGGIEKSSASSLISSIFVGICLEQIPDGESGRVRLLGSNVSNAILGQGFTSGSYIYLGDTPGSFISDPTDLVGVSNIYRVGIADCSENESSSEAKDLIIFPTLIESPSVS